MSYAEKILRRLHLESGEDKRTWMKLSSLYFTQRANMSTPVDYDCEALLHWLARAAITKYHRLGGLNNRNLFSQSLGG